MALAQVHKEVIHGARLGRTLGFPTANMDVADRVDLENGVYFSTVEIDGVNYKAMSNVGVRPSVDGKTRLLETFVLDYSGDLYGRMLTVQLHRKIRDERKFSSLQALQAQLETDLELIRSL